MAIIAAQEMNSLNGFMEMKMTAAVVIPDGIREWAYYHMSYRGAFSFTIWEDARALTFFIFRKGFIIL